MCQCVSERDAFPRWVSEQWPHGRSAPWLSLIPSAKCELPTFSASIFLLVRYRRYFTEFASFLYKSFGNNFVNPLNIRIFFTPHRDFRNRSILKLSPFSFSFSKSCFIKKNPFTNLKFLKTSKILFYENDSSAQFFYVKLYVVGAVKYFSILNINYSEC